MTQRLNEKQKKAVEFSGKHLLVLAGAGTGKTKTIISRATYLIKNGVAPEKIQIVTFTKRAANEIVERIKSTIGSKEAKNLSGATFHSWCNQLIVGYPNLFGTNGYTVIDQDDQLGIMKMVCGEHTDSYKKLKIKPQKIIDIISYARNTKQNFTETIRSKLFKGKTNLQANDDIERIRPSLIEIAKAYQVKKNQYRYLDYDDLLMVVARRLNKDREAQSILAANFEHLLIDEMQDTNPLQWELIQPFENISHLFCVGDDAQSIYSFRGADFKNVHHFTKRVSEAAIQKLDKNYRSTQEILNLSNWLLNESSLNYDKNLVAYRGSGAIPQLVNVSNEWEEARYISDMILENFTTNNKQFSDHLILSRSQYYTKSLEAVFIQKKIPYVSFGGRKFMEAAHIKDMLSVLRIINNPLDDLALMRFLTFFSGIGEVKASGYINEINSNENRVLSGELFKQIIKEPDGLEIGDMFDRINAVKDNVSKALDTTYQSLKLRLEKKYFKDWKEKREADISVLQLLAENYNSLGEFISDSLLDNSTNNSPVLQGSEIKTADHKDHVIISTVHSAKGLEADVCIVLNVSPKTYPSAWSLGNEEEVEEDRRVLYVALTRAKNELIITRNINSINATHKRLGWEKQTSSSAYFFENLPDNLVDQQTVKRADLLSEDKIVANDIDLDLGVDFS